MKAKDVPLEAMRGIAALVVVLDHSLGAFLPRYSGLVPDAPERLSGSAFYAISNGTGAVSLFFVLSGYILTRRYCTTGDTRILLKGAVKRWPRLMGPVLIAVLFSYALFYFHLYDFQEAGEASGSSWLTAFAGGFRRIGGAPDATPLAIHFKDALLQGSFLVFFRGDWLFDSSLWTMHPELLGSFIAFGAAPILLEAKKSSPYLTVALTILAVTVLYFTRPYLAAFPIGVALAVLLPHDRSMPPLIAAGALLLSLYLLGYPGLAEGAYAPFGFLVANGRMPPTYPQIVGAAILLSTIETFPAIRKPLSGPISRFLGELSFPIYLLHVPIICSVGSTVYLRAGIVPAFISVFAAATLASLPLMTFNRWWVARVNRLADLVLDGKAVRREATARSDANLACVVPVTGVSPPIARSSRRS